MSEELVKVLSQSSALQRRLMRRALPRFVQVLFATAHSVERWRVRRLMAHGRPEVDVFPPRRIRRTDDWCASADLVHASVRAVESRIDHRVEGRFPKLSPKNWRASAIERS